MGACSGAADAMQFIIENFLEILLNQNGPFYPGGGERGFNCPAAEETDTIIRLRWNYFMYILLRLR
jgi:hypothetical protein